MTYHLTWGGAPLCEFLGCMAGVSLARASGVHVCEFESGPEALRALDKLTPHTGAALALLPGSCPIGEAARRMVCEPHLASAEDRATDDRRHSVLKAYEGQRVRIIWQTPGGPSAPVRRWIGREVVDGCLFTTMRATEFSTRTARVDHRNSAVFAVRRA